MKRFLKDNWIPVTVFLVTLCYCIYMATNHSFGARCARVYEENTAQFELCVDRTSQGGPVFEENIGKM
jgi:hypothetical protein